MLLETIKYLKTQKHSNKIDEFKNKIYSHPNYPSLLAITDCLTSSSVENFAIKVPFKHFEELPDVFITELEKDSKEFYYIEKNNLKINPIFYHFIEN